MSPEVPVKMHRIGHGLLLERPMTLDAIALLNKGDTMVFQNDTRRIATQLGVSHLYRIESKRVHLSTFTTPGSRVTVAEVELFLETL